ncbi:spore coat protein CotJB [Lachnospiraceae bacterium ZAX-1]
MQKDGKQTLAIASVPCQAWAQVYEQDTALCKGTIFPELNMPFFVVDSPDEKACAKKLTEQEQLMEQINEVSFLLNDLVLYIDTHETQPEALKLFHEKGKERAQLMETFAAKFYPLTLACIAKCEDQERISLWSQGPIVWEGACV